MRGDLIARLRRRAELEDPGSYHQCDAPPDLTWPEMAELASLLRESAAALTPASGDNGSGFCVQCCLPMGSHRLQCPRDVQPAASIPAADGLTQLAAGTWERLISTPDRDRATMEGIILTALRAVAEGRR